MIDGVGIAGISAKIYCIICYGSGALPFVVRWTFVPLGSPNALRAANFGSPFSFAERSLMHLLYVDESGATTDASQRYFVLAGVSVFERTTHWIEKSLDDIAARIAPDFPNELEFHGSPMRSGKGVWRKIASPEQRESLIVEALRVGVVGQPKGVRLFACVVEKTALVGKDPVHVCFEQLARRFDLFLQRCHTKFNDHQRGLMLFDESSTEQRFQTLAREFKHRGHSYGKTRNYVEVPVFLDSRASRLIQLADLVAFAIFPHFEHGDSKYWDVIKDSFDSEGGVKHGFLLCDHAHPVLKRTLRGRSRLA